MDLKKLAPWNWFKKEESQEQNIPLSYGDENHKNLPASFLNLHREMNRMFDTFFRTFGSAGFGCDRKWPFQSLLKPNLDISCTDKEYDISVELPGIEPSEINLEIKGNNLIIRGEKKQEKEVKDGHFYRTERSFGSFRRILDLPEDADAEKISANYKNGIMSITVPRKEEKASDEKRIEVKSV